VGRLGDSITPVALVAAGVFSSRGGSFHGRIAKMPLSLRRATF
jgi:hypothetical protein